LLAGAVSHTRAADAPLKVRASNGVRAVLESIKPQAEKAAGRPLDIEYSSSSNLKTKLLGGEPFDVTIVASDVMEDLLKNAKVASGSAVILARCGIGIGVRAGAPKPDIHTPDALKLTFINAKSVTYAQDGASRPHLVEMWDQMGIGDMIKAKAQPTQGSGAATTKVANGEAALVLSLVSEIQGVKGVDLVGPLPDKYQTYVTFSAGVSEAASNRGAARAFIKYMSGPAAASAYRTNGMRPR
jgi:molybdate transport system substrate-binding protein